MAGKICKFPAGVQSHDLQRGLAFISTNTRARSTRGQVALVTDTVIFANGTGRWITSNQRVRINNIPTIGTSSIGISVTLQPNTTGTMIVVQGDDRIDAM
jgi:hypothetical protein